MCAQRFLLLKLLVNLFNALRLALRERHQPQAAYAREVIKKRGHERASQTASQARLINYSKENRVLSHDSQSLLICDISVLLHQIDATCYLIAQSD